MGNRPSVAVEGVMTGISQRTALPELHRLTQTRESFIDEREHEKSSKF